MRIHKFTKNNKTSRVHGGAIKKNFSKNVQQLTKQFSSLLGSKKPTKFVLKL